MQTPKQNKEKLENLIFVAVAITVVLVWFFLPFYMSYIFKYDDLFDMKGKFGDMYNVATSLFGALTIILLLYNTFLTRKELSQNREEFKIQNSTLIHQRFENTFFQLLKVHVDNVSGIDLRGQNNTYGKDCFKLFEKGIYNTYINIKRSKMYEDKDLDEDDGLKLKTIIGAYEQYYAEKAQSDLGHYFKTMYRIIKFIDDANHFIGTDEDVKKQKKFYTGILRAQLSTYEEILISYNAVSKYGENFKKLIIKYDLLKNCDFTLVIAGDLVKSKIKNNQ